MQTVQRLWNKLISLQVKMEALKLWRLFWVGVLWHPLEIVAMGIMSLAAIELQCKMHEQSRYRCITLKFSSKWRHRNKWHNISWISSNQELNSRILWQKDWIRFLMKVRSFSRSWKTRLLKVGAVMKSLSLWEILKLSYQVMTEQRTHYLKRKFEKYDQYFSHYKDFTNEIIENAYAEATDRTPVDCIYLIMLYLTTALSMQVDLSTKSFWLELTWLFRSMVPSSDLGKEK